MFSSSAVQKTTKQEENGTGKQQKVSAIRKFQSAGPGAEQWPLLLDLYLPLNNLKERLSDDWIENKYWFCLNFIVYVTSFLFLIEWNI